MTEHVQIVSCCSATHDKHVFQVGLEISGALPVQPGVMDTCIAGSQRWTGVVLATSPFVYHGYGYQYVLTHNSFVAQVEL